MSLVKRLKEERSDMKYGTIRLNKQNKLNDFHIDNPLTEIIKNRGINNKMAKEENKENKAKKPYNKFRAGNMTATLWENKFTTKDGKKITGYSVIVDKSYMDNNEEWQKTHNLNINDIPKAIVVMQEAYKFLTMENKDKDKNDSDDD